MLEEKKSRYTEAQAKAAKKYLKESVEDIRIRVPKGQKEVVKSHSDKMGESMNSFVVRAINEAMERDNQKPECQEKENFPPPLETATDNTQTHPDTASGEKFEERREYLLRQYEALSSTAGQGMDGKQPGSRHGNKKPETNPVTSPHETLDEKMERLRKNHPLKQDGVVQRP